MGLTIGIRNYDQEFRFDSIKLYRESQKSMTQICFGTGSISNFVFLHFNFLILIDDV